MKSLASKIGMVLLILLFVAAGALVYKHLTRDVPLDPGQKPIAAQPIKRPIPQSEQPADTLAKIQEETIPSEEIGAMDQGEDRRHADIQDINPEEPQHDMITETEDGRDRLPEKIVREPVVADSKTSEELLMQDKTSWRKMKAIQPQVSPEEFKLTILSDGPIGDYNSFTLSPPPKVVLDLPGKWDYSGRHTLRVRSDMVKRIRLGEHADKFRVVVDLKGRRTLVPTFEESSEGLIMTIRK